jgi:integrase
MKVTRLPSGAYTVNAYAADIRKRFTGPNKKTVQYQAAAWIEENKSQHRRGSFEEASAHFLAAKASDLSPSTIRNYKIIDGMLQKNYKEIYQRECLAITGDDLQELVNDLAATHTPKTVKNYVGYISAVFAYKKIRIPILDMPRNKRAELNIPEEFTVQRVLSIAKKEDPELWTCIALAAAGPLRRGEIAALGRPEYENPLEYIDFASGVVHVAHDMVLDEDNQWHIKEPKTATSDRYLTMSRKILDVIK